MLNQLDIEIIKETLISALGAGIKIDGISDSKFEDTVGKVISVAAEMEAVCMSIPVLKVVPCGRN